MMMHHSRLKLLSVFILIFTLLNLACGIQFAPGEIQVFSGNRPYVSPTPTPTATETPLPTPTPIPTPVYTVVPAAVQNDPTPAPTAAPVPAPPPASVQNVTITQFVDKETVEVIVDGQTYVLPYATLPPPPPVPTSQWVPSSGWDSRLTELGVYLNRAQTSPGQTVFRLVNARFEDESQANGLHHIYVEVLDENGQRILGQPVIQVWHDGQAVGHTEDKPRPEYALNFPMYGAQGPDNYGVYVLGAPSDVVNGMGLPAGQPVNYRLTFQRSIN